MKKVGVLTLPLGNNYGGVLQAYALLKTIEKMGFEVVLVNRKWNKQNRGLSYFFKKFIYKNMIMRKFNKFIKNEFDWISKPLVNNFDMIKLNKDDFYAFVVGSDQIWRFENTKGVGYNFLLDFVDNNPTKKISYAASFGVEETNISRDEALIIEDYLNKFDFISVREDSGIDICKNTFKVKQKVYNTLDPTLLLKKEDYLSLLVNVPHKKKDKYLLTYVLDDNVDKQTYISIVANLKGLKVKRVNKQITNSIRDFLRKPKGIVLPSIYEWLQDFNDADFIITDSYHGTIFSIIFNKQFISIGNRTRGLTRFISLLTKLNLDERLQLLDSDLCQANIYLKKINYNYVNKKLETLREDSYHFLISSLIN